MEGRWTEGVHFVVEDRGYETPCRIWQRSTTKKGYGRARFEGKVVHAHRIAFHDTFGWLPGSKGQVHHKCEVPACVNPEHLKAMTNREHNAEHGRMKLGQEAADQIRERRAAGESHYALAREFGVSQGAILNIERGRSYAV